MAITRISVVAGTNYTATTGTTISAAAQAHNDGNGLIIGIRAAAGGTFSLSDTAGNTGWRRHARSAGLSATCIELWSLKNMVGHATNVVTAGFSVSTNFRAIVVAEYSGLATDLILDQVASIIGERTVVSATVTSKAFTTEYPEELLIGLASADQVAPNAWSPGSGWTEIYDDGTFTMLERIESTVQSGVAASATYTAAVAFDILAASFLPPIVGVGGGGGEFGFAS